MEDRLAVISCIISDPQSVSVMNEKLHLHASMIIARLGVPCREYGVSVVSVVLHGTQNEISSFAGDLGKVKGVKVKSIQVPVNSTSDKKAADSHIRSFLNPFNISSALNSISSMVMPLGFLST